MIETLGKKSCSDVYRTGAGKDDIGSYGSADRLHGGADSDRLLADGGATVTMRGDDVIIRK